MSKIIGESFDDYVKQQIEIRQNKLGLKQNNDETNTYLTGKSSWIRLTSGIDIISDDKLEKELGIPLKYKGNKLAENYILFNGVNSRDTIYNPKGGIINAWEEDSLSTQNQYGFNSSPEYGLTPMPFIESIKVTPKNRGSLRNAEIRIRCFNKKQFDIIETLYMRLKYTLLLEWGHSIYYNEYGELITNHNHGIYDEFLNLTPPTAPPEFTKVEQPSLDANILKIQNSIQYQRRESKGNYDAFLGWIVNFKWSLNPDYSYNIDLKATTYGDVIESLSITSPVKNKPLKGEEESKNSNSPLGNTLKSIKNYLDKRDSEKFELSLIRYYASEPLTTSKIKEIAKLENIPYISPNDKEAFTGDALKVDNFTDFYYLKLGTLIKIIESFFYKYDLTNPSNPTPLNFFDTSVQTNFCNITPNIFSIDPRVCVVESDYEFYENSIYNLKNLGKGGFEGFLNKKHTDGDLVGLVMNIFLNVDMVLDVIDKNIDQNGNLPIFDFLKAILNNINRALGGVTDLSLSYDEDINTYFIIDNNLVQQANFFPESNGDEAALINVGLLTPNQGSFVLDLSVESTISNQMGSMLAIGAQSNNQEVGSNSIAISRWNAGLEDRVIPTKVTPYEEGGGYKDGDESVDFYLWSQVLSRYNRFELEEGDLSKLKSYGSSIIKIDKDLDTPSNPSIDRFFIPLSLNLTLDGLSGPKIYQKYTINDELLPQNYRDNIEFLIKGISHTVDSKGWITSLESIGTPKPRQLEDTSPPKNIFVPGEKPPYAGGRPPVSPSSNANRLRNVLTQLGYTEKGQEIDNAGDITANMADYAIALFREIKRRIPAISIRVTSGNDIYHANLSYVSSHTTGNALDFVITPASNENINLVESIIQQFVAGNRGTQTSYINEYTNQTIASTGRHFHLRIGGVDPKSKDLIRDIYNLADQNKISPLSI